MSSNPDPKEKTAALPGRRFGRMRLTLKWCRISLLLLVLVIVVLGLFLNHVGLPDWLTRRVEAQFRSKGWDLSYSRLRLRWYRGIVAEDLQLQRTRGLQGPHLFVTSAQFRLNWKAFWHFDLEANSAVLRNGRLVWELPGTNQPRRTLLLSRVGGELLFHPGDQWELKYFETELLGTHVRFRGEITNASYIREWRLPSRPPRPGVTAGQAWSRLLARAEQIQFTGRPELQVMFSGDAQNWKSFDAQARFSGEGLVSPWAGATNIAFTSHLLPSPNSNDMVRVELQLTCDLLRSEWMTATNVDLNLVTEPSLTQLLPTNTLAMVELMGASNQWGQAERASLELRSSPSPTNASLQLTHVDLVLHHARSPWLVASSLQATLTGVHPASKMLPLSADAVCTLAEPKSPWATSEWAQVRGRIDLPSASEFHFADTNLSWPDRFASLALNLSGTFTNLNLPGAATKRTELSARWRTPRLEWEADTELADASGRLNGSLNTRSREVRFQTRARAQPSRLAPFLSTNAHVWLALCDFAAPPRLLASGRFSLPAWTNFTRAWYDEAVPTLEIAGRFESEAGNWRGVPFLSVQVPFTLTNLLWGVPGLSLFRPEGLLEVAGTANQRSGEFTTHVRTGIDPMALRPAFPQEDAQRVFNFFEFARPPQLDADLSGNWTNVATLHGQARVALSNLVFRGQAFRSVYTRLVYTNFFLSMLEPVVLRDAEEGRADGIGLDLQRPRLFLTNAVGRVNPRVITRCIGPIVDRAVEPYVFDQPPAARVSGSVPLGESDGTENMQFEVEGGPFHWLHFNLERIKALVLWRGDTLQLTNVTARWYAADLAGWAYFDFSKHDSDWFTFLLGAERVDLKPVLRDLRPGRTNKVEGTLSGVLHVTSADSHDWHSWQGQGIARMTNGLLWDIPIFGVFSPVLNTFLPGLGNSRARHATAAFIITNSVIRTDDLVIGGNILRMNYQGSVDFDQKVDGRMQAEMLRDVPAFGFLVSKLLWPVTKLFDYRITGTLDQPKTEEVYMLSRILMMPLHPLKTLKDLINLEEKGSEKPPEKPQERPQEKPQ